MDPTVGVRVSKPRRLQQESDHFGSLNLKNCAGTVKTLPSTEGFPFLQLFV